MNSVGDQTFTTEDLEWRILDITGERVTLIAAEPINDYLTLYSRKGYINGAQIMNDLCKNLYGNGKGVQEARALNVDDINKIIGVPKTIPYTSINSNYGKQFTAIGGTWCDGTNAKGRKLRETSYWYNTKNYIDQSSDIYNVLYNSKTSWLAWQSIKTYTANNPDVLTNFHFHLGTLGKGGVDTNLMFHSDGWVHYYSYPIIPVIVLDSGILTTGQDENNVWQLNIE